MKKFLRSGDAQMRELYLSWNEFSSKAARFILEGVAEHTYLKVIDFSWNRIDHDNAYFLAKGSFDWK
jgi:Ran GTPase-activating protein (RanGAP) involved in mRNA processing and transport